MTTRKKPARTAAKTEDLDLAELSAFDSLRSSEGEWMPIINPATGKPLKEGRVKLASPDSDLYREAEKQRSAELNERARKNPDEEQAPLDFIERVQARFVARITTDVAGLAIDGKPVENSLPDKTALYQRYPFVQDQAIRFVGRRANFIKTSN